MESVVTRPHDLLRLATGAEESLPADAPGWTRDALQIAPWVVVRRATAPVGIVSVGIRGTDRSQRYAWAVPSGAVCEIVTPDDLRQATAFRAIAAMRAFAAVQTSLAGTDLEWGPTGSVGFELATGIPTATTDSDLDLVVRVPVDLLSLAELHRYLMGLDVRVDCQVDAREGAIALAELLSDSSEVLVKTATGPRLVARAVALI